MFRPECCLSSSQIASPIRRRCRQNTARSRSKTYWSRPLPLTDYLTEYCFALSYPLRLWFPAVWPSREARRKPAIHRFRSNSRSYSFEFEPPHRTTAEQSEDRVSSSAYNTSMGGGLTAP